MKWVIRYKDTDNVVTFNNKPIIFSSFSIAYWYAEKMNIPLGSKVYIDRDDGIFPTEVIYDYELWR